MKFLRMHYILVVVFSAIALLVGADAAAQYIWLNEKGVKQYSDMPPPPSVPNNKILKQPGGLPLPAVTTGMEANTAAKEDAPGENKSAEKSRQALTTAEKNAEFQKRKMEQAEKDKKAAEQEQQAAEKAKNCERAQAYQRSLESGERLARTDKSGERYFLNDQQRSQEMQDNKRFLDSCR